MALQKVKKAEPVKTTSSSSSKSTSSAPQQKSSTTPTNTSATTASSSTPTLDGNGNGTSRVTSSNFDYENSSIFDDDVKKDGKSAMSDIQGSSFYRGRNDTKQNARMIKQLNQIQGECKRWNVTMDADGDGQKEVKTLAQTVADSYDSVLDLYITDQVEKMMDKYGTGTNHGGYLSDAALEELAEKGIRADSVGDNSNRIYSFSLIDVKDDIRALLEKEVKTDAEKKQIWDAVYANDAVVMKDSNGKKGSCVFADCLVPDGSAQKCEINLSSILDKMGYDCISKADFEGKESEYMELLSKVEENINNGSYHELNRGNTQTISDTYGKVGSVRQALNTLWKHDTSGSGGGKFKHGLGDGSDAYILDNLSEDVHMTLQGDEETLSGLEQNLETDILDQQEEKAEDKKDIEEKAEAEEKTKEQQEEKVSKKDLKKFIAYEYDRIIDKDYLDMHDRFDDKLQQRSIVKRLSDYVTKKFGIEMTDREIYDIIF